MITAPAISATPPQRVEPWERPEVAALIPAAREKIKDWALNEVEKVSRASSLLNQIATSLTPRDGDIPFFRNDGETDDEFYARRRDHNDHMWADYSVLTHFDKGSDLTEERAARLHASARRDLSRLQKYSHALDQVEGIEDEILNLEKPSRTREILKERFDDLREEMSDSLGFALTPDQNKLLNRLAHPQRRHSWRRARFRLVRMVDHLTVLGLPIRVGPVSYRVSFESVLQNCSTLADIRAALACWRVDCRSERRDGTTVLITEHHEIHAT